MCAVVSYLDSIKLITHHKWDKKTGKVNTPLKDQSPGVLFYHLTSQSDIYC